MLVLRAGYVPSFSFFFVRPHHLFRPSPRISALRLSSSFPSHSLSLPSLSCLVAVPSFIAIVTLLDTFPLMTRRPAFPGSGPSKMFDFGSPIDSGPPVRKDQQCAAGKLKVYYFLKFERHTDLLPASDNAARFSVPPKLADASAPGSSAR